MRRLMLLTLLLGLVVGSLTPAAAAQSSLTVTAPANGAVIQGNTVKVEFQTGGVKIVTSTVPVSEYGKRPDANKPDEGHLHLTLDLVPLVVWDKNEAYSFTNVPPGAHQLTVELVNNDHSSLSPPVKQVIQFRSEGAVPAPATMPVTGAAQPDAEQLYTLALFAALALLAAGFVLRRRVGRKI